MFILFKPLLTTLAATTISIFSLTAQADTQIVNLDAKKNNQQNPVQLYLRAGTYQIKPIGRAEGGVNTAWSVWEQTSCKQARGCPRTVPTQFTGMHNNYYVMSAHLGEVNVAGKAIPQVLETPRDRMHSYYLVNSNARAFEVTQPRVYADDASALAGAQSSVFTMTTNGRIQFALLDNSRISDNRGGMSLQIIPLNTNH